MALEDLPNIRPTLAEKLKQIGIKNDYSLREIGSEAAIIMIASLESGGACLNMLYALEGAIQGIRWHNLDKTRKTELRDFYRGLE